MPLGCSVCSFSFPFAARIQPGPNPQRFQKSLVPDCWVFRGNHLSYLTTLKKTGETISPPSPGLLYLAQLPSVGHFFSFFSYLSDWPEDRVEMETQQKS
jgi:hypothetical protein